MSRERFFRVRSARSGGGRSRCRVVYRPAFRNMGQLFRPRAFRVAFPLSRAEYSGGRFCVLPRSGARLLFKESVESGESSRQGTTVRDALRPNRAGVSVRRRHMFSYAGLTWRIPADSGLTGPLFRRHVRARDFAPAGCGSRIRFGPCPESWPPEEGSCREPSASKIRRSAQRKLMRLGKYGGRVGRQVPGCD